MFRWTYKQLTDRINRINEQYGTDYRIGGAYGMVRLEKPYPGGGITDVTGYMTGKELANYIDGLSRGLSR